MRHDFAVASDQNESRIRRDLIGFENPGFAAQYRRISAWRFSQKVLDTLSILFDIHAEDDHIGVLRLEGKFLDNRPAAPACRPPGGLKIQEDRLSFQSREG